MIGKTILHYHILDKIGAGGMGVVYKAQDTKLDRFVALKFLPPYLGEDEEKKKRFIQEAKAASALDHPNICTIYEINETDDGQMYIAMAYYEGETLKLMIDDRRLTIEEAVGIVVQIAEGLERAHQKGIVHRDIKPANIMVTEEGTVKILDFGVAKMADIKLTKTDSTLGTIAYMSPEQVRSEEVDRRADIWSLGVIIYEMLCGQLPFSGDREHALMYAILNREPQPLKQLCPELPASLIYIVNRALEKEAESRYQSLRDMMIDLRQLSRDSGMVLPRTEKITELSKRFTRPERKKSTPRLLWVALPAVLLFIVIIAFVLINRESPQPVVAVHKQVTFTGDARMAAISPDGTYMAYWSEKKIWIQDVGGGHALEIFSATDCAYLLWSPDGSELMFSVRNDSTSGIFVVSRLGGTPRQLRSPIGAMGCWSPDGSRIAYSTPSGKQIFIKNKFTAEETSIALSDTFTSLKDIKWSSTNKFLFLTEYKGRYTIRFIDANGEHQGKIVEEQNPISSPRWSSGGNAVYYIRSHGDTDELVKISVDPDGGRPKGSPTVLLSGLKTEKTKFDYYKSLTISYNGKRLLYPQSIQYSNLWLVTLGNKREGETPITEQLTRGTSYFDDPVVSPDGKWIAFSIETQNYFISNIYIMPLKGGPKRQLTSFNAMSYCPAWSPDGERLAFNSNESGSRKVWVLNITTGLKQPVSRHEVAFSAKPVVWAPGSNILYHRVGLRNYQVLDPDTGEERPLVTNDSLGFILEPSYSPDGNTVAIYWNQNQRKIFGIWLISLEDSSQVSLYKGVAFPIGWSPDGKWVFFVEAAGTGLMKPEILRINVTDKKVEKVATLPFENITKANMSPDARHCVCRVDEILSDIWMIENFDPEVE